MSEPKTLRMLHTADVHLERLEDRACKNLQAMVRLAVRSRVSLVVIAGDFFDNNRVENPLVEFAVNQLESLPVPVVILPGNHDCLTPDSVYKRAVFTRERSNIHVIRQEAGETLDLFDIGVNIWGRPVASYFDLCDRPLVGMSPPSAHHDWNIIVAHGNCVEGDLSPASLSSLSGDATARWHYIALGHKGYFKSVCEDPVKAYYVDSSSIQPFSSVNIVEFSGENEVRVVRSPLDEIAPAIRPRY